MSDAINSLKYKHKYYQFLKIFTDYMMSIKQFLSFSRQSRMLHHIQQTNKWCSTFFAEQ